VKIAFHTNQIGLRGSEIALYDYAKFNEDLLGHESVIVYPSCHKANVPQVIQKFSSRFRTVAYSDFSQVDKTFSFPIFPDGGKTIPARASGSGMQDGIDLINALAANPNTARYLASKLYRFFVSERGAVNVTFVNRVAAVYLQSGFDMKAVMREVLSSPEFWDESAYFARYAWPVEFVVRAFKDVGWTGFSVNDALTPLSNMGQILLEPPDVSGWDAGQTWFSTGAMLARLNFASSLAANQKFNLATAVKTAVAGKTPEALLA